MTRGPAPIEKDSPPLSPHLAHYTLTHSMPEMPSTPAPTKARISHLESQISELVRRSHAIERKHKMEVGEYVEEVDRLKRELKASEEFKTKAGDMDRMKAEAEQLKEELNLHSLVQQQKALLAVVSEQMDLIDMEYQNLQLQSERVMRDYKMTLFEAREDDLNAELAEKDAQMADLEIALAEANTSIAHQQAAESKAAREETKALAARIVILEKELKVSKEKERTLRTELDSALTSEQSRDGSTEKEKSELKKSLRETKAMLAKKTEEFSDLQEELSSLQEASKEREKTLKAKIKDAVAERDRLVGVEVELESLKSANAKLRATTSDAAKKAPKAPKSKKPASDSEDEIVPAKKARKAAQADTSHLPALKEMTSNDTSKLQPSIPSVKVTGTDNGDVSLASTAEPEKKKKRKLFGAAPAFTWDPIMSSGDGVIPACLSPVKPNEKAAVGTIPRKGFGSMASARNLSRLV
ncbi:hypothetical protein BD324DRAFT_629053 [Kockovaella imperatae]|uniref:Uncharacterized protein n=1 Tax=Kockovaella imperatae TaxID=4999 RepID=A0A1Y1UEM1_9TREE|nr:hypothetical protein BD324DRAFT_629053 [Kockovaella imperatae]ORX36493.1 hypothetical protein BD324DRAFT_629053 [Kockovaella imperatae]